MLGLLLIILLTFLLLITLSISKDLLSPTSILCLVFIFATSCALYNSGAWFFSLDSKALSLLLTGIFSFALVAGLVRFFTTRNIDRYASVFQSGSVRGVEPVNVSDVQAYFAAFFFVGLIVVYLYFLRSTVGNFVQLKDIAYIYRTGNSEGTLELPFIARLSWTVLRGLSIVVIYVLVRNAMAKSFLRYHGLLLSCCVLLYGFIGLVSGERASSLRLIALAVIVWGIFWKRQNPTRANVSFKLIVTAIIGFVLVLYGFSAIRFFVGRTMSLTPIDYITYYAGVPIYNFNYATSFNTAPSMDGAMTFRGLHNNLARVFGGVITSVHRAYVVNPYNKLSMGNVYTFMFDYYHDYGVVGIIVLTSIYSLIINMFYTFSIYRVRDSAWRVCLYGFIGTTIFFTGFTEQFYSTYLALTSLEVIVTIWVGFGIFGISSPTSKSSYRRIPNVFRYTDISN